MVSPSRLKLDRSTQQTLRVACMLLAAIGLIVCAVAVVKLPYATLGLATISVLLGVMLIIQVVGNAQRLSGQSMQISQSAAQAEEHYVHVLRRMLKFLESGDKYSHGKSERIGNLTEKISRKMGLADEMCRLMNLAGQLHDIGLAAVPAGILGKRSPLGSDDMRTVHEHCDISYEILKPLRMLEPVLSAIRHHHERMNGTGYPAALSGQDIPLEARILAVADAYDAMTHDRPQRSAMSPLAAMDELKRCTPAGFDPACVEALAAIVNLPELEAAMGRSAISHAALVNA